MTVNSKGKSEASLFALPQGILLNRFPLKKISHSLAFSEDKEHTYLASTGSFLAIHLIETNLKQILSSNITKVHDIQKAKYYTSIDWIGAKYLCVGTDIGCVQLFKLSKDEEGHHNITAPFVISGLKSIVVGAWFAKDEKGNKTPNEIYAIDEKGNILHWKKGMENVIVKHLDTKGSSVFSCDISTETNQIAIGIKGGCNLFSLEDYSLIKEVKFSDTNITSTKFSKTGDWIAMSGKSKGLLVVYDIKSETYIMKQQGHESFAQSIAYNTTGDYLASGDYDGKIKVWDCKSGVCFITLDTHKGPITNLKFSRPPGSRDPALFTSSLDGTCRAFDLLRYKNFRTYQAPLPTGFTCMEIDPSGEIISAAGMDEFEIYLWNVQTAQILDTLKSHTAPISELSFSNTQPIMVSGSWDKTVKIWDIFGSSSTADTLNHTSEVLSVAFNPSNGVEICVSTLDGNLSFWDVLESSQTGYIEGRRDIISSHYIGEDATSLKVEARKYFSKVRYTSDGSNVICGGLNQFVCLYSVEQKVLLKRFTLSTNLNLNGVIDMTKFWTDVDKKESDFKRTKSEKKVIGEQRIPGSKLEIIPEIRTHDISFTSSEFAVSTTEGIAIFSSEVESNFNPLDLDIHISPENIKKEIKNKNFGLAMIMAIRLNDSAILTSTFESIPFDSIDLVIRDIPEQYLANLLSFLSVEIEKTVHMEKILKWTKNLLFYHGKKFKTNNTKFQSQLRAILRSIKRTSILDSVRENNFALDYLTSFKKGIKRRIEKVEEEK